MAASIGEQLKTARIERGVSLDQATQATRIRKHYLEALESDQKNLLPSAVQGKGFLRLYAGYLNLPVETLAALWDGKTPSPPQIEPPAEIEILADEIPPEVPLDVLEEDILPQEPASEIAVTPSINGLVSAAIFKEIGEQLRLQRESLGLSQAEVERYTRLRQHYIQAMEQGSLEDMPSPVQARGMLSIYSTFVNLDEDKILLRFAEGLQIRRVERIPKPAPPPLFSTKKKPAKQAPLWRRFITPDLVFGIGLAVIILFFIVWAAARIDVLQNGSAEPTTPAIVGILLTPLSTQPAAFTIVPGMDSTAVSGENAEGNSSTVITAQVIPAFPTGSVETVAPGDVPVSTPTLPPMNEDPLQVYIVAHQRAWLRVLADDQEKFIGRVVPGNAYAFSGERRIELLTGNAAGLQVFFNQNDLGTLGIVGEVVGLIFTIDGVTTATMAVPPTRTPAAEPSITPLPTSTPPATPTVTPFVP